MDARKTGAAGDIVFAQTMNAPADRIWKALTGKDQMKQWYFDLKDFKAEVGFKFQFYGGTPEKQYLHLCRITEVVPQKKLAHSWRYDGYEGNSLVTFELSPAGNNTNVKLTHSGTDTFPKDDPNFARESFIKGWTYIVGTSLKTFVEKN
ncbi:MAG TPA: SRPBCC domain-containing protein [Bacteroidota bacterium]|nr:SRPBCC domain-containing protein [Bacteroidota bacterium]